MTVDLPAQRPASRPPEATRCVHLADLRAGDTAWLPNILISRHMDREGRRTDVRVTWDGPLTVLDVAEHDGAYTIAVSPHRCAFPHHPFAVVHGLAVTYGAWVKGWKR